MDNLIMKINVHGCDDDFYSLTAEEKEVIKRFLNIGNIRRVFFENEVEIEFQNEIKIKKL